MFSFTIPAVPVPQERVRGFSAGGHVRFYDPARSRNYKEAVAACALMQARGDGLTLPLFPKGRPVCVEISVFITPPESWNKSRKKDALDCKTFPTGARDGDVDNYAKSILDGITRSGLWKDDKQVISLTIRKIYARESKAVVRIGPVFGED